MISMIVSRLLLCAISLGIAQKSRAQDLQIEGGDSDVTISSSKKNTLSMSARCGDKTLKESQKKWLSKKITSAKIMVQALPYTCKNPCFFRVIQT